MIARPEQQFDISVERDDEVGSAGERFQNPRTRSISFMASRKRALHFVVDLSSIVQNRLSSGRLRLPL